MKRKTRNILIAAGAALVVIAAASALFLSASSTSQDGQAKTQSSSAADGQGQGELADAQTADWLEAADSNLQLLVSELCAKNWKSLTNDALVSFAKDGTFAETDSSGNVSNGTWRLDDMKLATSNGDYRECTAVITVNGNPHTFTSYLESVTVGDEHVPRVTQYIHTSGIASGKHLAAADKEVQFTLSGLDGDLSSYIADQANFTGQFVEWCKTNAPLATGARWNRDVKISYDKQTAVATFTCNDSKQTKVSATLSLTGSLYNLTKA